TKAIETLHNYGVGSCGPPGFYGTLDVHINLEKDIARFLGTESAIIYAQAFSTISSVIAAFSKRGDIIVVDDGCNFAVQKGTQISRSNIKWFKHNDMEDLERILQSIQKETTSKKRPLTRRFIVTEGLFQNYGDIAPLDKIMELKHKYKYRVILDESCSFGVMGKTGRGLTEVYNIPPKDVDMIIGSMANTLASAGGFCAGSKEVVDHQRLSGQAFVFSASIPAMLTVCASEAIKILEDGQGEELLKDLHGNAAAFRKVILSAPKAIEVTSDAGSPFLHLRFPETVLAAAGVKTIDDEKVLLQAVVDEVAIKDNVLITRAKYIDRQEMFLPRPSIRISLCASHSRKDVEKAAQGVKAAFTKVISARNTTLDMSSTEEHHLSFHNGASDKDNSRILNTDPKDLEFEVYYFKISCVAATAKHILAYGKANWTERFPDPKTWEESGEEKFETPFGVLPILRVKSESNEVSLAEALVIDFCLAKKFNLLGSTDYEEQVIKAFYTSIHYLRERSLTSMTWVFPERRKMCFETWFSLADIHLVGVLDHFAELPRGDEIVALFRASPLLWRVRETVLENAEIASYRATDMYKDVVEGPNPKVQSFGGNLMNLASSNFLGYLTNENIK
ncbi:serine palmitoyltransferase component, partial [Dissophora globulifera]